MQDTKTVVNEPPRRGKRARRRDREDHFNGAPEETTVTARAVESTPVVPSPSWVTYSSEVAPNLKRALANHAAYHLIRYGKLILIASGTSLNCLMDEIIARHVHEKKAFDLIILTSNLQVLAKGRDAQLGFIGGEAGRAAAGFFNEMQIILTGGTLRTSLDSLTGPYAARGVNNDEIHPDTVFFGAAGLSFRDKQLTIRYHFQDEISTQVAYATRPTEHRVLLCDHTKLGTRSGLKADLNVESLLEKAARCTIITTEPEEDQAELQKVQEEVAAFRELMLDLKARRPDLAERIALRLIDHEARVKREIAGSNPAA